jgi:DNA-binding transcriptional LysR family regulator
VRLCLAWISTSILLVGESCLLYAVAWDKMQQSKSPRPVASAQQVDWNDIRLFLSVLREGGMRAASQTLGVDASTVSRRLAHLETALGAKLFERHPTGLKLTAAGEEAARFGDHLDDELRELQIRVASIDQELSGCIRITCADVIAQLGTRLIQEFLAQHHSIHVELTISDAMMSIERHEVDIAMRVADSPPEDLVGKRVGQSAVGLFASSAYVKAHGSCLSDPGHFFVEWPRGLEHKPAFQWLNHRFKDRSIHVRTNSAGAVLSCCRAGLGVAPLGIAQAVYDADLVLLEKLPESCSTSVWLLTHRDMRETARVRAAMDYLALAFKTHSSELG